MLLALSVVLAPLPCPLAEQWYGWALASTAHELLRRVLKGGCFYPIMTMRKPRLRMIASWAQGYQGELAGLDLTSTSTQPWSWPSDYWAVLTLPREWNDSILSYKAQRALLGSHNTLKIATWANTIFTSYTFLIFKPRLPFLPASPPMKYE